MSFRGRLRGRSVMFSPRRLATRGFQGASLRGTPRVINCRTHRNASSLISQFRVASTGHGQHVRSKQGTVPRPCPYVGIETPGSKSLDHPSQL